MAELRRTYTHELKPGTPFLSKKSCTKRTEASTFL